MAAKTFEGMWRTGYVRVLLGCAFACLISACGGSGNDAPTISDGGNQASPANQTGTSASGFHAWWVDKDNYLFRQDPGTDKSEPIEALGQSTVNDTRSRFSVSRRGDLFIETYWVVEGPYSTINMYSRTKLRQASDSGNFTNRPREAYAFVPGLINYHTLSNGGRYVAASWSKDIYAHNAGQVSLAVFDMLAPGGAVTHNYALPGASSKILGLQWVSDHEFVLVTEGLRLFLWNAVEGSYIDIGQAPREFNGYQIVGVNFSPDANQVVGLMTRDGKTHEAFVAKGDFTNMRQLTNAGIVIGSATWMNSGLVELSNLVVEVGGGYQGGVFVTDCRNYLIPTTASNWSQAQVEASKPANLPCQFQASD